MQGELVIHWLGPLPVDFVSKYWGDLASLIGLVVSVVGLTLTVWYAQAAKNAAEQALAAASAARDRIITLDAIGDLSSASTIMQDIMRLQRSQAWNLVWEIVLERYAALTLHLSRSQSAAGLNSGHRDALKAAVGHFYTIMKGIEDARTAEEREQLDTARFNKIISQQAGVLEQIRGALRAG